MRGHMRCSCLSIIDGAYTGPIMWIGLVPILRCRTFTQLCTGTCITQQQPGLKLRHFMSIGSLKKKQLPMCNYIWMDDRINVGTILMITAYNIIYWPVQTRNSNAIDLLISNMWHLAWHHGKHIISLIILMDYTKPMLSSATAIPAINIMSL